MSEPDLELLNRAASCYQRAGTLAEAARCYHEAGSHRRAADLHERIGRIREAARDYALAGDHDLAAWLLVHEADDAGAARDVLAAAGQGPVPGSVGSPPAGPGLRRRLVLARCDVADGRPTRAALKVLADARATLATSQVMFDHHIEPWSVALARAMHRDDQVALVFAAAVRGRRPDAEHRWRSWLHEVAHSELVLPPAVPTQPAR